MSLTEQLFRDWHHFKESGGQVSREELARRMEAIRAGFRVQLAMGQKLSDGRVRTFSPQLEKLEERLWVFVKVPGVEPTNNGAERDLRPAVIWPRCETCYSNQSEGGCRFVERMLTVSASCRVQGHNLLDFVSRSLEADWFGQMAPELFST